MIKTYQIIIDRLHAAGIYPNKHVLDNEISAEYKKSIKRNNMIFELVPEGMHRQNISEKAIQAWKAHFIAIICGVSKQIPMNLWNILLPQTYFTLNLLRQSNVVPKVSEHVYMNGPHNFNCVPLTPIGREVQMHDKPIKQKTFATHSTNGFWISLSFEHYRGNTCWVIKTGALRNCDTIFVKHKYIKNHQNPQTMQ